ncbi:MAG TPA: HlyD family secretion protein [Terriglobales bacterium]|nr:HlyD family secretion protein [Terriglobales bacterium]
MSTVPASSATPPPAPEPVQPTKLPADEGHGAQMPSSGWMKYMTPILVLLLAVAILVTITRNWNAWEGGHVEQVTDDAYVRGDLTPLSTKVAGIVQSVLVSDYQQVHKGELLVQLEDSDYQAQVEQASAAVEAAKAAIDNNLRQRELQDARIQRALAGIDQAKAQIAAAQAGKEAVQAELVRARSERMRQEGLYQTHSTTQQRLEQAVADEERLTAQLASREADLEQARTLLRSNELAAEAERRQKIVLQSQEMQLLADERARAANLVVAQVNLGYTKISAPGDGSVGERQVRPGQLVSPGTQVIPFVDRTRWVQANYKETQLTNVKVGDAAEIRIDKYPGKVIHGRVIEIAPASGSQFALLPPDNATGNFTKVVQRIPVKIALDDTELARSLQPGLSVTATVRTRH